MKMHDHPELFKHFVLSVVEARGVRFFVTRDELKQTASTMYGFAYVPELYGTSVILVKREDSFMDKLFRRTFDQRCDTALKYLKEVCLRMDDVCAQFYTDFGDTVSMAKKWEISKNSVPVEMCPRHDD